MIKDIPKVGLGTWLLTDRDELKGSIKSAIESGYKHIDTAQVYNNEFQIGEILKELKVDMKDLFITSKVVPLNYEHTIESTKESLRRLQMKQIDLMILHAAFYKDLNIKAFKDLVQLQKDGLVRHIGVSNFSIEALEEIHEATGVWPYINQVVLSPITRAIDLEKFCMDKGIKLVGYSIMRPYFEPNPFFENSGFTDDQKAVVETIAKSHKKDVGQVLNKWALQLGYHVIPKSSKAERVASNFLLNDFELTEEEMKTINSFNKFDDTKYAAFIDKWKEMYGDEKTIREMIKTGLLFDKNFEM